MSHLVKSDMLSARSLVKSYGTFKAVDGVSLEAGPGQIVGLLGPNGAGKTTTVSMISGLLRPDTGEVRINGQVIESDTSPVKQMLGLVPQDLALFEELPAGANLALFASLYGLSGLAAAKAIDAALDLVGLRDRVKDTVASYSGGMKRRLNLAGALLHDPQVLLLDEPTVGVDPQSRNAIFENLEYLKSQGKTLIYTTHYMEEVERLCDRIVIIDGGKTIADDSLEGLLRRLPTVNVLEVSLKSDAAVALEESGAYRLLTQTGRHLEIGFDHIDAVPVILARLGDEVEQMGTRRPTLENVFLQLTGRSLRD